MCLNWSFFIFHLFVCNISIWEVKDKQNFALNVRTSSNFQVLVSVWQHWCALDCHLTAWRQRVQCPGLGLFCWLFACCAVSPSHPTFCHSSVQWPGQWDNQELKKLGCGRGCAHEAKPSSGLMKVTSCVSITPTIVQKLKYCNRKVVVERPNFREKKTSWISLWMFYTLIVS